MNCSEEKALLLPYLHGELARSERALVRAHLDECAACRAALAEIEHREVDLRRALSRRADQAHAPARAWLRLAASVQAERRPHKLRWFESLGGLAAGVTRLAASAMAIGMVAVAGVRLMPQPVAVAPTPLVVESPGTNSVDVMAEMQPDEPDAPLPVRDTGTLPIYVPVQRFSLSVTPMSGEIVDEAVAVKPCGACARPLPIRNSGPLVSLPIRLQVLEDGMTPDLSCVACVRVK
jgi:Putative zinc-finger